MLTPNGYIMSRPILPTNRVRFNQLVYSYQYLMSQITSNDIKYTYPCISFLNLLKIMQNY